MEPQLGILLHPEKRGIQKKAGRDRVRPNSDDTIGILASSLAKPQASLAFWKDGPTINLFDLNQLAFQSLETQEFSLMQHTESVVHRLVISTQRAGWVLRR